VEEAEPKIEEKDEESEIEEKDVESENEESKESLEKKEKKKGYLLLTIVFTYSYFLLTPLVGSSI
jgi:hypothetical protein